VTFNVQYASVTGFIGANGSGKTTTMRIIAGLTQPTSGYALVAGAPYAQLAAPRKQIGIVLSRIGAIPA
jgi:ABC-2 type transport system ATP-binding protein